MANGNNADDKRLIEDYLPIEAISAEASREKSVRMGHISTLHLWWARRPLVACRAAVYGALVPADRWVKEVTLKNPPGDEAKAERVKNGKKLGLNRKAAKAFVERLCRYPSDSKPDQKRDIEKAIAEAQQHILEAHADRLTAELAEAEQTGKPPAWVDEFKWPFSFNRDPTGSAPHDGTATPNALPVGSRLNEGSKTVVTYDDIVAARAPRPRVLDMFAGGGAIPLEALRLGCEAYALDLNPVAHIIQLCTLVYPQKYGRPDPTARGMTGPKNGQGETTWGGLAEEVRYWGQWVLERVRKEIGDLYPLIPDPNYQAQREGEAPAEPKRKRKTKPLLPADDEDEADESAPVEILPGYLMPVAYLWTRTVRCKNPSCAATVPLVRQTWLRKKKGDYAALRMVSEQETRCIRFEVRTSQTETGLGFDPTGISSGGNATCQFCGTVSDVDYVKDEGWAGRIGAQLMAAACIPSDNTCGKKYVSPDEVVGISPDEALLQSRIKALCESHNLTVPNEQIANLLPDDRANTLGIRVRPYGIRSFGDLFHPRQLACLLSFTGNIKSAEAQMTSYMPEAKTAVVSMLACFLDRMVDFSSTACVWNCLEGERTAHTFGRHAISMTWDYAEADPFNPANAGWTTAMERIIPAIKSIDFSNAANVRRASATAIPLPDRIVDAVITDPPYYDNVPYADISDFFYVWLRRAVGHHYPSHFATGLTPKKAEAIADPDRHNGSWEKAKGAYERMMQEAFLEAHRFLRDNGQMGIVYAHKTTLGWATLVDALRRAGFTVTEAWPLDTEKPGRLRAQNSAALASSIFLVARKRSLNAGVGNYEDDVQPDLAAIVRERVETLWEMGIAGADLVIACVGAGLRAFTKYEKVEYANGEEVPAARFLTEVETVVLDSILGRLSKEVGGNGGRTSLAGVDPATRFYTLWRYTYRSAELDAGEAIIFANGTHVELDGQHGMSSGARALVEKKKGKYRLRDFTERGDEEKLGLPNEDGQPAPLIDALHRTLWLMEHRPTELSDFLHEAQANREQMRLVAQALAGPALKGGELADISPTGELSALAKLTANWRSVVEANVFTPSAQADKKRGQKRIFE